jgi:hypothetical protein
MPRNNGALVTIHECRNPPERFPQIPNPMLHSEGVDSLGWYVIAGNPLAVFLDVTVLDLVAAVSGYIWPTLTSLTRAVKKAWMGNRGADLQLVPCAD